MFYLVHVLLGGVIGLHLNSIALVVLIAFLSHFLIDSLPHWGIGFDKKNFNENYSVNFNKKMIMVAVIDGLVAIFALIFLYEEFASKTLLIGCIASVFPDVLSAGYLTKRIKNKKKYKKFLHFHSKIQRHTSFLFGMLTQVILIMVLVKILLR